MAESDHTKLPKLTYKNFQFWKSSLQINAALHDADHILSDTDLNIPVDPAAAAIYNKEVNKIKALILQSLPDKIVMKLPANVLDSSPRAIFDLLGAHISTNNMQNHDVLEAEARSVLFLPGTDLDEYVTQHESIRTKMINTGYPQISDKRTTVKFMVQGLRKHPDFSQLAIILTGTLPATIRSFANSIRQALLLQDDGPAVTPIQKPIKQQRFFDDRCRAPRRQFPQFDRKCPKPAHWSGPWCTFHASPSHNTNECRQKNKPSGIHKAPYRRYQALQVQGTQQMMLLSKSLHYALHQSSKQWSQYRENR